MKNTMRASMALEVTCPPQVGPTSLKLTLSGVVSAALASASWALISMALRTATALELRSTVTWICLVWLNWLVSWTTVGSVIPADSTAEVAWATVRVGDVTSHDWPPLKSMPRLRPRVPSETMPSRMTTAEAANHHLPAADEVEGGLPPVQPDEARWERF